MLSRKKCFPLAFIVILVFFSVLSYSQDWKGKGRLKGVVLGEDGEPVANATIIFTHVQLQSSINSTTNEKGEFLAAWIKGGLWNVDVEAEGYLPRKMSYNVSEIIKNPPKA